MSLKRILGIALASRMAGRGRRRGGLGTAGLGGLGGLGYRRRSMLGGKAGLAALGYMAYKEYRNHQARTAPQQGGTASGGTASPASAGGPTGAGSASSGSGGIGDMVQGLIDKVTAVAGGAAARPGDKPAAESQQAGAGSTQSSATEAEPTEAELREDERAADQLSDEKALLLLRAMITAAYADGAMSTEERQGIMKHISEAGGDEEDRQVMEREIANPKSLDELLEGVHDRETAEQVYLASSAAVDGESDANRAYLENLRERLNLTNDEAEEIDKLTA